jgi:hypothetical protein
VTDAKFDVEAAKRISRELGVDAEWFLLAIAEIERLQGEIVGWELRLINANGAAHEADKENISLRHQLDAQAKRIAALREALEFYSGSSVVGTSVADRALTTDKETTP